VKTNFLSFWTASLFGAAQLLSQTANAQEVEFCGARPRLLETDRPTAQIRALATLPPADALPDATVVDVLLLYTPQAVIGAGGEEILRKQMLDNIEEGNSRFANSLINVRLRPVYIGLVNYTETGDMFLDGSRLINATDGMQKARTLRNDYKADITVLVTELENNGAGGDSWSIPSPTGGDSANAACLVRRLHLRFPLVMVHEIGHLLGCDHSRENSTFPLTDAFYKQRFPYIFGNRFEIEGVVYADTMTYPPGVHLPLFGNPEVKIDGVATGSAGPDPQPANTARTINQIAPYVAKYRESLSRIEFTTNRYSATPADGTVTLQLQRTGDLSGSTRITVSIDSTSTAVAGVDYARPATFNINFAANQAAADFTIALLTPATPSAERTLQLSLTAPVGNHGIGWEGTSTVTIHNSAASADPTEDLPGNAGAPVNSAYADILGTPGVQLAPNAGLNVMLRADGKLLLWGHFSRIGGRDQTGIALADENGRLDETFRPPQILAGHRPIPGLHNAFIGAVQPLPDSSIIIGGLFSRVGGEARLNLAKLHSDGSLDSAFKVDLDGAVYSLARQPDGQILACGLFKKAAGESFPSLIRVNENGELDRSFKPNIIATRRVMLHTVMVQPDGRILIGGAFTQVDGSPSTNIARLNADGSRDQTFNIGRGASGAVHRFAIQPDGRILVAGRFLTFNGQSIPRIARLFPNGEIDSSFRSPNPNSDVKDVIALPDGRILITGFFTSLGNSDAHFLAALREDGSFDPETPFGHGPDDMLGNEVTYGFGDESTGRALALGVDGSLYVGGAFRLFNRLPAPNLVRLAFGQCAPKLTYSLDNERRLQMVVHGVVGGAYQIQASGNLADWETVGQVQFQNFDSTAGFTLSDGLLKQAQFFRLKQ
jgi:uncharacterized delta-60 repeat protein